MLCFFPLVALLPSAVMCLSLSLVAQEAFTTVNFLLLVECLTTISLLSPLLAFLLYSPLSFPFLLFPLVLSTFPTCGPWNGIHGNYLEFFWVSSTTKLRDSLEQNALVMNNAVRIFWELQRTVLAYYTNGENYTMACSQWLVRSLGVPGTQSE
jgi:hypothetical protein